MLEIISQETKVKFEDSRLQTVTNQIVRCGVSIRNNFYKMAHLLYKVHSERLFVNDGFMSAAEYAEKTFGFKKSLCYNLISVGELYTAEDGKGSNLPHDGTKDYTSSQLKVILPYTEDDVRELAEEGVISPYMTVNALKKKLKEELSTEVSLDGEMEEAEAEMTEGAEDTEAVTPEANETEYVFEIKAYNSGEDVVIESSGEVPTIIAEAIEKYLKGEV